MKTTSHFELDRVTPEILKADLALAQAKSKAYAQQVTIEGRLARRLTGNSAEVGQGKLFADDADLFSGPALA